MLKAVGGDVKKVGFHEDLLKRKFKKYYVLFGGKEVDCYEKSKEARDEQLFSFYLGYKRGVKGELMRLFEREFYGEARRREKELYEKFFGVGEITSVPEELKGRLRRILEGGLRVSLVEKLNSNQKFYI